MRLIHSAEIPKEYLRGLDRLFPGLRRMPLPTLDGLYDSIAAHPDISLCCLDPRVWVASPAVPAAITKAVGEAGVRVVKSASAPRGRYPGTASLNAARIGGYLLHHTGCTDAAIRDLARERGLEFLHVKQGYARCSVVPVGQSACVTGDPGIAKMARTKGLDIELVRAGAILLPGEKHGFIGGACGLTPEGTVVFLGDVRAHPDFGRIGAFFGRHRSPFVYLEGLPLFDAGGLLFF